MGVFGLHAKQNDTYRKTNTRKTGRKEPDCGLAIPTNSVQSH